MFSAKDLFFTPPSGAYQVTKSLRFRSSATAYLNRTFSAGNRTTWTWSGWVKRGKLGSLQGLFVAINSGASSYTQLTFNASDNIAVYDTNASTATLVVTSAVYRDPSAWMHCVFAYDTNNAAAANRFKMYVNGAQVTAFSTNNIATLSSGATTYINSAVQHNIGNRQPYGSDALLDGYLAEVNFIDGSALDASSFGAYDATTGVWMPAKYTGSYTGTSYYLPFSDTTSTTTLVADSSGLGNSWTPNNISLTSGTTYDSMLDSPTNYADGGNGRGNYCTLNPLDKASNVTLSNANLSASCTNTGGIVRGTIGMTSGKWYWEFTASSTATVIGIAGYDAALNQYLGQGARGWSYYGSNGNKINNGSSTAYGNTFTTNDVIGIAFDATNGKLFFSKNNTWQNSGDPVAGTNAAFTTGLTTGPYFPATSDDAGATQSGDFNFGQRPFTYTPPNGYSALNTQNMTTPTILNGASYMAAVTYTGTGSSQTITASTSNSGNNPLPKTFQPDLVWIKSRSNAQNNKLTDVVRGTTKALISNTTGVETTDTNGLTAFTSSGFTIGSDATYNTNTYTYVAWEWNAGSGTSSVPTGGNITVTSASVNASAGFSILKYTGNGSTNQSVPHGLGVAPGMVIVKNLSNAASWCVHHQSQPTGYTVYLNLTNAQDSGSGQWGSSAFTSSLFYVGYTSGATGTNNNTDNYIAYCFAPVSQYSSFGTYTGNGSSDGPFIYTNFRPRWLMTKRTDSTSDWAVYDSSRDTYNVVSNELYPDLSSAESATARMDFLSNGVKIRNIGAFQNASGGTYIYAAFAENPFTISRAR